MHGTSSDASDIAVTMHAHLRRDKKDEKPFDRLRIGHFANRRSIICQQQYTAYFKELGLGQAIRPKKSVGVIGIGERRKAVGIVRIQIPFKDLSLVIDVDFLVWRKRYLPLSLIHI